MRALALLALAACLSKPGPPGGDNPDGGTMIDTPPPSGGFVKLSVGDDHACAIDGMQRLYCWGRADYGQLGNLTDATPSPTLISQDAGWTDVAAGGLHTCGILNGKVRCWGADSVDQSAHGTLFDDLDLGGFQPVSLFVHDGGSCALDASGALMCWGQPAAPVGDPKRLQISSATLAIAALAQNDDHACALTTTGHVYCWGANALDQLGTNASGIVAPDAAVEIDSGKTYNAIAIGGQTTCGIRASDRAIECWGDTTAPMVPGGTPVVDATRAWTAIAMGNDAMCGLAGAELRCWGYSEFGQAALGITDIQSISATAALTGVASVGMGDDYGCALTQTDGVACWGQNRYGNIGNGQIARAIAPVDIFGTGAAAYLAVGESHACLALETTGDTYCWGDNRAHQVHPTDSHEFLTTPTELPQKLALLSAGRAHTCGILANDHAFCWGNNDSGQLGGGSASTTMFESTRAFTWISAGIYGTCGISAGKVYCWGMVNGVDLGSAPMLQPLPAANYTQVVLGDSHVLATDGAVIYGWGDHCAAVGSTGTDIAPALATMVDLPGASSSIGLAAGIDGGSDSCAVTTPGGLYCWGKNEQSELSSTETGCLLPFLRTSDAATIAGPDPGHLGGSVTMANDHGCVLSTDGNAVCWGDDDEREIGSRGDSDRGEQLLVPFPTVPYGYLAVGTTIGCGIHANDNGGGKAGHVECWGTSPYGELGNGTMFVGTPTPVLP